MFCGLWYKAMFRAAATADSVTLLETLEAALQDDVVSEWCLLLSSASSDCKRDRLTECLGQLRCAFA